MPDDPAYFDTGQREQLDERTTWHGHGWHYESGDLRMPVGPETTFVLDADGTCHVYQDGRRCW